MLKTNFFAVVTVLLLVNAANAMIGLGQGYNIGAVNGLGIDGQGVATGGSVLNVDNSQNAMNLGRCGNLEMACQKQSGILVQGGTAIGANKRSDAFVLQGAGADSGQCLLVTRGAIIGGQKTDLCLGQAVYADDGAAANAGQGAILANAQLGANNSGVAGNTSVVGAVNTSSAIAGPCSDASSGNAVNVETSQSTSVL